VANDAPFCGSWSQKITTRVLRFFLRAEKDLGANTEDNFISSGDEERPVKDCARRRLRNENQITVGSYGPLITVIRRHSHRGHHVSRNGSASS